MGSHKYDDFTCFRGDMQNEHEKEPTFSQCVHNGVNPSQLGDHLHLSRRAIKSGGQKTEVLSWSPTSNSTKVLYNAKDKEKNRPSDIFNINFDGHTQERSKQFIPRSPFTTHDLEVSALPLIK